MTKIIGRIVKKDVVDIICDICGDSCQKEYDYEYSELKAIWGYDSKKDLENWEMQFCEKCSDKIITFIRKLIKKEKI